MRAAWLELHGVDTSGWGAGKAKFSDKDIEHMSTPDLRRALQDVAPGVYTQDQIDSMTPEELRQREHTLRDAQLGRRHAQPAVWPCLLDT